MDAVIAVPIYQCRHCFSAYEGLIMDDKVTIRFKHSDPVKSETCLKEFRRLISDYIEVVNA